MVERNTEHVVKSCRNLVTTEIKTLRHDLGNLRGFLRNCQDTINSETSRLEKRCLGKIEDLEEERVNLEKAISTLKEENESLQQSSNALAVKMAEVEKKNQQYHDNFSQIQVHVKSLESQLTTKITQCEGYCKKLEDSKLQCLSLENKLASNEAYVKEQKSILEEMARENKQLESDTKDLQMRTAESEEYEKALESHIEELEAICSILREQHDEQRKYFLQKESSLKREAQDTQRSLQAENKKLAHEIELLTSKLKGETSKYLELLEMKKNHEIKSQEHELLIVDLNEKIDVSKHDLQIEKATVEMLSRKNNDLTAEISALHQKLSALEEKATSTEKLVNRKALKEIGNTVQQYFDDNSSLVKRLESSLIVNNNEKLEECERQLVFERKKRLNAEMDAANLSVELEKAKVEIAVYRSNASDTSRRRSLSYSKSNLLALPGLNKSTTAPDIATLSSTLPISSANDVLPTFTSICNEGDTSKHSNESNASSHIFEKDTLELDGEQNTAEDTEFRPITPDIKGAVSVAEISISNRASRKMEEATRKAMEMLNKSKESL